MRNKTSLRVRLLAAGGAVILSALPAAAKDVYLVAAPFLKELPDEVIPMWGYVEVAESDFAALKAIAETSGTLPQDLQPQAPGPVIAVDSADPRLDIHLLNWLDVPTSVMIPGQALPVATAEGETTGTAADRVWVDGGVVTTSPSRPSTTARIRSMTRETAPRGTMTYSWENLRPGAYLYRSGTHLAVQVQMGLSGAVKKGAAANQPYPGVPAAGEVDLVYSEIDPALHKAVADGTFGTIAYPSSLAYRPTWHMINGVAFDPAKAQDSEYPVTSGSPVLLRFYNAGLRSHQPVLLGHEVEIVAEDGNPYPYRQRRYAVQLEAGKTKDAVFTAPSAGQYTVLDYMQNSAQGTGGMTVHLNAGQGPALVAVNDSFGTNEDTAATGSVLGNDTLGSAATVAELVGAPVGGLVSLGGDGSFTFTPYANLSGSASFSYRLVDGLTSSNVATVSIAVAPVNDAPTAAGDSYAGWIGEPLAVSVAGGVLKNDGDVDGDPLTAQLVAGPAQAQAFTLNADGSFSYTSLGTASGSDQFTYRAWDGAAWSAPATVSISLQARPNKAPVAVNDSLIIVRDTTTNIAVLANDTDSDGTLVPSSVTIVRRGKGTTTVNPDGTVTYTPRRLFTGTDSFTYRVSDDDGAVSNVATVTVNVVRSLARAR